MKIGDKVAAIDDALNGVITGISEEIVTVLTEDDFEMQFPKNELVVIENMVSEEKMNYSEISKALSEKQEKKPKKQPKTKPKDRKLPPMVVDLHIEQLTKDHKRMSNYDMLTLQLDTAKRQLNFAINKRIPKVVLIHGVGAGVLRTELEFLLKRYDNLKFYDADYQKYGRGAVEVYFFQRKMA